jgi:hypothetical protein
MQVARPNSRAIAASAFDARKWTSSAVLASIPFVLAIALFLAARRMMSALSTPLAPWPLIATAGVLLVWLGCVAAARESASGRARVIDLFSRSSPLISVLLIAFACSYTSHRVLDWLVWLPSVALAAVGPQLLTRTLLRRPVRATLRPPAERVLQLVKRFRDSAGRDVIHATLTAQFEPGERHATLYVAFCPPFERLPEANLDFDVNIAAVKLTQVLHNGAQLDVRLGHAPESATSADILLVAEEPAGP